MWSPEAIAVPDPPIDLAAVNPWMLRMAGEVADAIHVHPRNTPIYLRDTVAPNLKAGASTAGRTPAELEGIVPTIAAPGSTSDDEQEWLDLAPMQLAFHRSTPHNACFLDQLYEVETPDPIP